MPTITPTAVPPLLAGLGKPYRLYSADHLAFDALPPFPAGPALIAHTQWTTAILPNRFGKSVTVHVHRPDDACRSTEYHQMHGVRYARRDLAVRALFEAGLSAFMVFERDAARLGLPFEADR